MASLRAEVKLLHQTVDVYMGTVLDDLQQENERLRAQLRATEKTARLADSYLASVPPPYPDPADLSALGAQKDSDAETPVENAASIRRQDEMLLQEAIGQKANASSAKPLADAKEPAYTVIAEWGRTPEDAARLGDGATSLKGMICAVPADCSEQAALALGRGLRSQFAQFDNLNIDVFNDTEAAKLYSEKNVDPFDRRVLSVSRHRKSGRDIILLYVNGAVREIPWHE